MRLMRWLAAVTATVAVFGGCLWLFRFASWSWMPHATTDRWAVAAAFATVTAGAVGAAGTWWASREIPRRARPADAGGAADGPVPPQPSPRRPRRFPTVDDVNRALGRDTSKGATDTISSAPTHDG